MNTVYYLEPTNRPTMHDKQEATARFVRAVTHWLRDEDDAARAWLTAALFWAPAAS